MKPRIHHHGIVVRDIRAHVARRMSHWIDPHEVADLISDPLQQVRIALIYREGGLLELIEPAAPDSPVSNVLKHQEAMHHHVCFEVVDLEAELERCRGSRMAVVSPPQPAVAFAHRKVAFVMGRDGLLWELLSET